MAGKWPRGLYRIWQEEGVENDAYVEYSDGGPCIQMLESQYRERWYEPPFEELPWQDEYNARKHAQTENGTE